MIFIHPRGGGDPDDLLTKRQSKILYSLIQEYIRSAEPVASAGLAKKCKFGFSSATVRNEFAQLEEMGFLDQPYTSAGRVPTDKAYRYFVDGLLGGIQKERQSRSNPVPTRGAPPQASAPITHCRR